ncbi:MAG: hypothetical protein ABIN67_00300 [Ferruginibacter sp.]
MSEFELNPDLNIEVIARFLAKGEGAPVTGDSYTVRLYDKDLFDNEFLGESGLDSNGYATISFTHAAFSNVANIDTFPDLYFAVFKDGEAIYKSKVMEDVDLSTIEEYKKGAGEVIDLGTYLIEA